MKKDKKLEVKGLQISILKKHKDDFISLTDVARYKNPNEIDHVLQNWMRNLKTIEFLGLWEKINNPNFKPLEFEGFKIKAGAKSFSITAKRWIEGTDAIGLISKSGRYNSGTFAHKDIAFEFASWISPEFKLYLIKEFQRLKDAENQRLSLNWDIRRELAKVNYKVHTDAIKKALIPSRISKVSEKFIYPDLSGLVLQI